MTLFKQSGEYLQVKLAEIQMTFRQNTDASRGDKDQPAPVCRLISVYMGSKNCIKI